MPMSRRQFMRWEKLRMHGKRLVVLRSAAIATAILFVVVNFGWWLWSGNPVSTSFLFTFPAAGIAIGLIMWSINEDRFAQFLEVKKVHAEQRRNEKRQKRRQ